MKPTSTPLHGTYFDLLKAKYPDLAPSEGLEPRQKPMGPARRRPWGPTILLLGILIGVSWLAIALRPERPRPVRPPQHVAGLALPEPAPALSPPTSVATQPAADAGSEQPTTRELAPQAAPAPSASRTEADAGQTLRARETPSPARALLAAVKTRTHAEQASAPEPLAGLDELATLAAEAPAVGVVETLDRRRVGAVGAARAVQAEPFQPAPPVETIAEELSISAATPEAEAARAGQEAPSALPSGSQLASQAPERTLPQPTASEPTESRLLVDSRPVEAQPSAPEPFKVGGVVKPPRRLVTPLPEYPDAAWARGVTGDVLVRAVIDERGKVADVEVLRGLPYGMTEAAVAAIERWRFAPATRHGEAVAVYRNLSVRFES